jgi:hypothetical protein
LKEAAALETKMGWENTANLSAIPRSLEIMREVLLDMAGPLKDLAFKMLCDISIQKM